MRKLMLKLRLEHQLPCFSCFLCVTHMFVGQLFPKSFFAGAL